MERINILNVKFDNVTMAEAINKCADFLKTDKVNAIVTPNPEIVMQARKDSIYQKILNNSELVIPDGIGVVIGSKILKTPLKERVAGYDLICNLLNEQSIDNKKIYILGAKPGVAEKAKKNIEIKYNAKVVGLHDGYFKEDDEESIIKDINNSGANIILVGLGMVRQEKFIDKYKKVLNNIRIAIGCGGSIDVLAGVAQRAPKFYVEHNLEWFYRLVKQPTRIGRMMQLPKFLLVVAIKKNNN